MAPEFHALSKGVATKSGAGLWRSFDGDCGTEAAAAAALARFPADRNGVAGTSPGFVAAADGDAWPAPVTLIGVPPGLRLTAVCRSRRSSAADAADAATADGLLRESGDACCCWCWCWCSRRAELVQRSFTARSCSTDTWNPRASSFAGRFARRTAASSGGGTAMTTAAFFVGIGGGIGGGGGGGGAAASTAKEEFRRMRSSRSIRSWRATSRVRCASVARVSASAALNASTRRERSSNRGCSAGGLELCCLVAVRPKQQRTTTTTVRRPSTNHPQRRRSSPGVLCVGVLCVCCSCSCCGRCFRFFGIFFISFKKREGKKGFFFFFDLREGHQRAREKEEGALVGSGDVKERSSECVELGALPVTPLCVVPVGEGVCERARKRRAGNV